jgi:glycosyltransferase involved in cell wall biosynthesis
MVTYQQQNYIGKALDSVLEQQTTFSWELIVGDDHSSDETPRIVEEVARQNPGVVRLFRHPRNLGPLRNFRECLHACRGRYVAILDGDDYWCSPEKLAKQIEALEQRPDCAICASRARVVYEKGERESWEYPVRQKTVFTLDEILRENIIPSCTAVFRLGLLLELPEWYMDLALGDWALYILLCRYGDALILPETLAVYRVHGGGVWSGRRSTATPRLEFYDAMRQHLPERFAHTIDAATAAILSELES